MVSAAYPVQAFTSVQMLIESDRLRRAALAEAKCVCLLAA